MKVIISFQICFVVVVYVEERRRNWNCLGYSFIYSCLNYVDMLRML